MSSENPESESDQLKSVFAAYIAAKQRGEEPDQDAILKKHPEFRRSLREFFASHDMTITLNAVPTPTPAETPTETHFAPGEIKNVPFTGRRIRYFGQYELIEEVARGGMGVVFKARQTNLNRIVALKMILSGELAGTEQVMRFKSEAEAAARLDHPGIVPIFEIGEHDSQHYFSMGFVDGESLADRLRVGPLQPDEAVKLLVKICDAVSYAHDKGVIHRDLKPGNVLIDRSGTPRVTDFGLAKQVDRDSEMTRTGQVLGTPAYMPPEQASGNISEIGPLADVYSLGAMLYAMLTGRPPFQASSPVETLRQVLEQEPASPRIQNAQVSKDLDTICLKCLNKEVEKRFESADALAADLRRYLAGEPIHARPTSRSEKVWKWCKRNPRRVAAMSFALLVLVAVGSVISIDRTRNRSKRLQTMVESINSAQGTILPSLTAFESFPRELVLDELRGKFDNGEHSNKLALAFAMAHFGDVRLEYLVAQIEQAIPNELQNFADAMRLTMQKALTAINAKAAICDRKWAELESKTPNSLKEKRKYAALRYKARLAMLSLHLGNSSLANDMCQLREDPIQRTVFIDECSTWCGDLVKLGDRAASFDSAALRSAICLVVGSVSQSRVTQNQKDAWRNILSDWHMSQPDTGVHSASGWALGTWQLPMPALPKVEPELSRDLQKLSVDVSLNVTELRQQIRSCEDELQKLQGSQIVNEIAMIPSDQASISASGTSVAFVPEKGLVRFRDLESLEDRELGELGGYVFEPAISPGANKLIALVVNSEMLLWDPKDKTVRSLGKGRYPTWSQDGVTLFFLNTTTNTVMSCNVTDTGSSPKALIDKIPASFPAVSPDASKIAFTDGEMMVVLDIATRERLASYPTQGRGGYQPGWAPDSRHVGFGSYSLSEGERGFGLWILDTETGSCNLAVAGNATRPSWSSDGSRMLYEDRTNHEIHIVDWSWERQWKLNDVDQTRRQLLLQLAGADNRLSEIRNGDSPWRFNEMSLTMLRIQSGSFENEKRQTIEVNRNFLISDREISVGQFRQFIDDPDYPASAKPSGWKVYEDMSAKESYPVQGVSWFDAAMFCNWLSHKEGISSYYQRFPSNETDSPKPNSDSFGYRLPTADEWEHACRAGVTKNFTFGDDEDWIDRYGVDRARAKDVERCGSRLPNAWGLFDVHGNVRELCHESTGKSASKRVVGGSYLSPAGECRCSYRWSQGIADRKLETGFRVAAFPSTEPIKHIVDEANGSPLISHAPETSIAPRVSSEASASSEMKRITITTKDGRGADVMVDRTNTIRITGLDRIVGIKSRNGVGLRHSYLRFDLAKIENVKKHVRSAGIVLTLVSGEPLGAKIRVHVTPETGLWTEETLEWKNSYSESGIDSLPLLCEITVTSKNIHQEGDLFELRISTPEFAEFIRNVRTDTINLVLAGSSNDSLTFESRESKTRRAPKLVVLTPEIPPILDDE